MMFLEVEGQQAGVDLRRLEIFMTEHFRDILHGSPVSQKIKGERMAEPVRYQGRIEAVLFP